MEISTYKLSLGTHGGDVARVHQALHALGLSVSAADLADRVMGTSTVAVIKALQAELNLSATGVVDAATVRSINVKLTNLTTNLRVLRGRVRDANGKPFTNGGVQIFGQGTNGEHDLGTSRLSPEDGSYTIRYQPPADSNGHVDLRVVLSSSAGTPLETIPSSTSILAHAGPLERVDLVLSGETNLPRSEFEVILEGLNPLLGGRNPADLTEEEGRHEVSLLAIRSGYRAEQVAAVVLAHRRGRETMTPPEVFYALFRHGLPTVLRALYATDAQVQRDALQAAVAQGTVPKVVAGKPIEEHLTGFVPLATNEVRSLLGRLLNADELEQAASQLRASSQDPAAFWQAIAADPAFIDRADEMKRTVQVAELLNNHAPLVETVLGMAGPIEELTRLNTQAWKSLIQTAGVPEETPGSSAEEQVETYARQIICQLEAAFPTRFMAERLNEAAVSGALPVAAFLKNQPAYDLRTSRPESFFKAHPEAAQQLTPPEVNRLTELQRVRRVLASATKTSATTTIAEETIALTAQGVRSAYQIAGTDPDLFARQHQDILSEERAREVHEQARRTNATVLALMGEHSAALNQTDVQVLPKLDIREQQRVAQNGIPDWGTLFGDFNLCACAECNSAHGPAAYFVDALQFLSKRAADESSQRSVKDKLFERRPDLGEIELSCENTNTVLPYVDLVNEILEHAVAPFALFTPLTLAPEREADLDQTAASADLTAAFTPPLGASARIQMLETGSRWRIWDEAFAYSVVKASGVLTVVARSQQTDGTTQERRATPQYRNRPAYAVLGTAVYPLNLPFDLAAAEVRAFLSHMDVPRDALIEALRLRPGSFDPNAPLMSALAAERLGLTDTERKIIIGEALDPPVQLADFWGAVPAEMLKTVQELLDRFEISYTALETLLTTWFVNPAGTLVISAKLDAAVATCNTHELEIIDLTEDVLARMHRFLRLWRKLGWMMTELDTAIHAFVPAEAAPVLTNEILVRLDHLHTLSAKLRLPVVRTLALWNLIDTAEPDGLYQSLFYNPAVFSPPIEDFRLRPDGKQLVHSDQPLAEQAVALQAVFRLTPEAFALLAARTTGKLTLANLSFLYRHAILARQLGLSVQDLLLAIDLTGIEPFNASQTQNTLRLVEVVLAIRSSGFSYAELDYLTRHQMTPGAPFVPTASTLAETLTDVRASLLKAVAETDAEQRKLQESTVIDRVAAALSLPADVTAALLDRVQHAGIPALQRFVELAAIAAEQTLSRDDPAARPSFEILEKLLKIATFLQTLELPSSLIDWLFQAHPWLATAEDQATTPAGFAAWFPLIQFPQLRRELALEAAALEAILTATSAVVTAADQASMLAARNVVVDTLSTWLGWPHADLETLLGRSDSLPDQGLLNARTPDDYQGLDVLIRVQRVMNLVKRLGVTALQANTWCDATVAEVDAKAVRSAAKAKHSTDAWLTVATALQDDLRNRQREALVRYLVARPDVWTKDIQHADANDLYAHFVIDVEMDSCQLTSRLKQAIGSVQLFAQRALLGLEPGIKTTEATWLQWEWMKNFRVWEANRKIWLYPENWLEPELRDDKTPFFKELEDELLQGDLDNASAEQALLHYLEKLDAVANLEIMGVYEDDEDQTLHVFGRTFNDPHVYYHRRRDGRTRAWKPWEQLALDIEGDHLIPIIWNRRLMLIWPIFTEKAEQVEAEMPEPGAKLKEADRYWDIQLAWSEYQHGRWSGKYLSKAVKFKAYQGENNICFNTRVEALVNSLDGIVFMDTANDQVPPDDDSNGDADEDTVVMPSGSSTPTVQRELVAKEKIAFKAISSKSTLEVLCYLRRDYRTAGTAEDSQIACVFGGFQFAGCRNIVTAANHEQVSQRNMALAPRGTKFDHMWFTGTAAGLHLFDGKFPMRIRDSIMTNLHQSPSIVGNESSTVLAKLDIQVLARTPSPFRLLAPHQDMQFVGDRPCFFVDNSRTFMVTSTGSSGKLPDLTGWLDGNLVTTWRADYFPQPTPTEPEGNGATPLTVLALGRNGRRVPRDMVPVNLQPSFRPQTHISTFWTTRTYRFANFHHPYLCDFEKILNRQGIPGLLSLQTQSMADRNSFAAYEPAARVLTEYPVDEVDFQSAGAYQLYNWELFFHIPLLIATCLQANQRFQEAQRWFHCIFDPTRASSEDVPQRYWRTRPFHERLREGYEAESVQAIEELLATGVSEELKVAVAQWRDNPFNPHAVARLRTTAYQKSVVMKYIDNLIAWGDQLFRRETLEALSEATQIYVLAAEILGPRRELIERDLHPAVQTFNTLASTAGGPGNPLEQMELLVGSDDEVTAPANPLQTPSLPSSTMLTFGIPENNRLIGYWDTVTDRLFKLRHCMNIEGQVRQLPLFEPPIDPALLVRARAAGLSIRTVLSEQHGALPPYRFSVMLQKANELVGEVKNLGAALLAALEKRDAEALSTLRSGQELRLLEAIRDTRVRQIEEAKANIAALEQSRAMAQTRKTHYADLADAGLNSREITHLILGALSVGLRATEAIALGLAGGLHLIPDVKLGAPTTSGVTEGGTGAGESAKSHAASLGTLAAILDQGAALIATKGGYIRRAEDWDLQTRLAETEEKQIDQQLIAAEIRLAVAEQELRNHDRQIEHGREVDQFLRGKFSNQELYQFMTGQISGLYFQTYQLAYDLARKAEQCFHFELGLSDSSYITFGYWDNLKKGLLSGEKLQYDLRRLEAAYLEQNRREFELTKHVSLRQLDPLALLKLKSIGSCQVTIPEWLYDRDCPGHYMRRIKSVALSIPAVVGPYTSVNCTLSLLKSSLRKSSLVDGDYARQGADADRFVDFLGAVPPIVTSGASIDSGLFETNLRDERFLPFEGAGAESTWKLDLPANYRAFDYATISDVILHIRYTARQGVNSGDVNKALGTLFQEVNQADLALLFSLRHDFPTEWAAFVNGTGDFTATIRKDYFPYFAQGKRITIAGLELYDGVDVSKHHPPEDPAAPIDLSEQHTQFTLTAKRDTVQSLVSTLTTSAQVFLIVPYTLQR